MPRSVDDLTAAQLKQLAAEKEKAEKADRGGGHSARFSIDLGDPKQVKLGRRLGLIPDDDDDDDQAADDDAEGDDDEGDADEKPRRRGYFNE